MTDASHTAADTVADTAESDIAESHVVIVAVDGPAGSGKSSVSKQVARALGFGYLDTGAAYRALAWHALAREVDSSDATAVLEAVSDFDFRISLNPDDYWVRSGEVDVTARSGQRDGAPRSAVRRRRRSPRRCDVAIRRTRRSWTS